MATLTINVPAGEVTTVLLAAADEYLDARGIDRTSMTATQRAQRYVVELLKSVYIQRKQTASQATAQTTVASDVVTATTTAGGIT